MSDYYDREGRPLDLMGWAELHKDREYKRVGRTDVGKSLWVSTVWLGSDHNYWGGGPPLIFETMVFGRWGYGELRMWRYSTLDDARLGHDLAVEWATDRYHGLVKHARDERRERMKADVRMLEDRPTDPLAVEMREAGLALMRLSARW